MAQPPRIGEQSRDLRLRVWRGFEPGQRGFDEIAREARGAVGLGANARAGVKNEQADAKREAQREPAPSSSDRRTRRESL